MRQVLSLSLPEQITKEIKISSKQKGFSSVSGYIKYLFELDKNLISEKELLSAVREARKEYAGGKTIKAKSITDLL
jgi:Arc/MetJ-type ribon-helix-helix transcriptional regulator